MERKRKRSKNERNILKACFWWLWWVVKNNWLCALGFDGVVWQEWLGSQEVAIGRLALCLSVIDCIYAEGWSNIAEHLATIPLSFSLFHCLNLASKKWRGRRGLEVQNGGKNKLNGPLPFKSIIKGSGYILKSIIYFFRNLFSNKDVNQ